MGSDWLIGGRFDGVMVFVSLWWRDLRRVDLPEPECPVMRVRGEDVIFVRRVGGGLVVCLLFGVWSGWRPKGRRAWRDWGVVVAGELMVEGAQRGRVCLLGCVVIGPTPLRLNRLILRCVVYA